jgi:hypothetical protein
MSSNAAKAGYLPHITESAEGRGFAFTCDSCFVIGKPKRNRTAPFGCGKHRRAAHVAPIVVEIHGDDCTIKDVSAMWTYDERRTSIIQATSHNRARATNGSRSSPARRTGLLDTY